MCEKYHDDKVSGNKESCNDELEKLKAEWEGMIPKEYVDEELLEILKNDILEGSTPG